MITCSDDTGEYSNGPEISSSTPVPGIVGKSVRNNCELISQISSLEAAQRLITFAGWSSHFVRRLFGVHCCYLCVPEVLTCRQLPRLAGQVALNGVVEGYMRVFEAESGASIPCFPRPCPRIYGYVATLVVSVALRWVVRNRDFRV